MAETVKERALKLIKAYVAIIIRLREGAGSFETVHETLRYDATHVFVEALAQMGLKNTQEYAIRFTRGACYEGALKLAESIFTEENTMAKNTKAREIAEQIRKAYCVNYPHDGAHCSYTNSVELEPAIKKVGVSFKITPSDLAYKLQSASREASAKLGGGKDKEDVLDRWADVIAQVISETMTKAEAEEIVNTALKEYRALAGGEMPDTASARKAFLKALGHENKAPKVTLGSLNFSLTGMIYVDGVCHDLNLNCGSTHNMPGTGWAWIVENLETPIVADTDAFRDWVTAAFAETVKAYIPKQILAAVKEVTRA